MRVALYDATVDGKLIYVGITCNPKDRLAYHKARGTLPRNAVMTVVRWYRTRNAALKAEAERIRDLKPRLNIRMVVFTPAAGREDARKRRAMRRELHKLAEYAAAWESLAKAAEEAAAEIEAHRRAVRRQS